MIPEGLDELERRVVGLLEHYRAAREQLRQTECRLEACEAERARLAAENERLRGRVAELESEQASRSSREEVVRNRIQQIVGHINSLEAEIARMEPPGHES
ncbi:MAG: hypothetical protein N3D11_02325 [Candidatus Sumerlaeia bacterium]|nr:hypothetical protein [Candidatus Sumerlaeia bacterium]